MIDTNALLSIGFSIVSNFANLVLMPAADGVPTKVEDLTRFRLIVPPLSTHFDLGLIHRHGTIFTIRDGAVCYYVSGSSFAGARDPAQIPRFVGLATLTSNQIVEVAARTVEKLVKTGTNPIAGLAPKIFQEGNEKYRVDGTEFEFYGKIPFYIVSWPDPTRMAGFESAANIEIDARNGSVTKVTLWDEAFEDHALLQVISNRVYVPDLPKPSGGASKTPAVRLLPPPTTNDVQRAIESWRWLCRQLRVPLGSATNVAGVDWEWNKTFAYTNEALLGAPVSFVVTFTNGALFCAVRGGVANILTVAPDPAASTEGTIRYKWQDLCENFERTLVEKLGIPRQCFAAYRPIPPTVTHEGSPYHGLAYPPPAEVGSRGYKIARVDWTDPKESWPVGGFIPRFHAIFDLESGALRNVAIVDPQMVEALSRAQGRPLNYRFLEDTNVLSQYRGQ